MDDYIDELSVLVLAALIARDGPLHISFDSLNKVSMDRSDIMFDQDTRGYIISLHERYGQDG